MAEIRIDEWFVISIVIAVLIAAAVTAWYNGAFDRLYVQMCEKYFRAKAKTEMLSLKAKGKKEGVDFVKEELDGSKQAGRMQEKLKDLNGGLNDATGKDGVVGQGVSGVTGAVNGATGVVSLL